MNAALLIRIGITIKQRATSSRWKETTTLTETWHINTDLEQYSSDLEDALTGVWAFVINQRTLGAEVTAHYSVRLENVTAATPAAGSWVQAKQHYDGALTDAELSTQNSIAEKVSHAVAVMRELAKY